MSDIAEQLRAWRGVDGAAGDHGARGEFSQAEAAKKLGVPLKTYLNWEQGRRAPRGLALQTIVALIESRRAGPAAAEVTPWIASKRTGSNPTPTPPKRKSLHVSGRSVVEQRKRVTVRSPSAENFQPKR